MPRTAEIYARFAAHEAFPTSPLFEKWARGTAGDVEFLRLIDELPPGKRQPNLVFAAARLSGCPLGPYDEFRAWTHAHWPAVKAVALVRSTQTNEPGRCAALLPFLAEIDGPIALLELGASAGLCLFPDRYVYEYATPEAIVRIGPPAGPSDVVLRCQVDGIEVPDQVPEIVWRAGIDLNPLSVDDADSLAWLETLIWPEHDARRQNLVAAARIASAEPPLLVRGDMVDAFSEVIAEAPRDATLVVSHSAALMYLSEERGRAVEENVRAFGATWISYEKTGVVSGTASLLGVVDVDAFVIAVDGTPRAIADAHGTTLQAAPVLE